MPPQKHLNCILRQPITPLGVDPSLNRPCPLPQSFSLLKILLASSPKNPEGSALSAGLWSHVHRVNFWIDSCKEHSPLHHVKGYALYNSSGCFHRLWMGTLRWVTPRDQQLFPSKTIHFHRNYVTDRDKQGSRAKFSPATLPTLARQVGYSIDKCALIGIEKNY